jgi:hypothetical protein
MIASMISGSLMDTKAKIPQRAWESIDFDLDRVETGGNLT